MPMDSRLIVTSMSEDTLCKFGWKMEGREDVT